MQLPQSGPLLELLPLGGKPLEPFLITQRSITPLSGGWKQERNSRKRCIDAT
jgi:hypothetical protein